MVQSKPSFFVEPFSTQRGLIRSRLSPSHPRRALAALCPQDPKPPSTHTGCSEVYRKDLFLPGRWFPGLDISATRGNRSCCLTHPLLQAAQMVHLPPGQSLQQQSLAVMLCRSLQLGPLLGYPPVEVPPAPKPGPETA